MFLKAVALFCDYALHDSAMRLYVKSSFDKVDNQSESTVPSGELYGRVAGCCYDGSKHNNRHTSASSDPVVGEQK